MYLKNYTEEMKEVIFNIKLTVDQSIKLNECMLKIRETSPYYNAFEDMYKLYIGNISVTDIAKAVEKSERTIQILFKKFGMARDLKTAQSIAVKKRDYAKIREKRKRTMIDRQEENILEGSKTEQFIRTKVSIELNSAVKELGGEAIIGVNTITPVGELDIPIVILINNTYYKYGIELDGQGYHENGFANNKSGDILKEERLNKLGYKVFRIYTKAYFREKQQDIKYNKEATDKLNIIIQKILKDIS